MSKKKMTGIGDIKNIKEQISPVLKKYGIKRAAVFGSFARGDAKETSDVDILIEFGGKKGVFEFIALKLSLERKLHRNVDLVEYNAIEPRLKDSIMRQQVQIV